jgi:acyl-CoA dehydrogenase
MSALDWAMTHERRALSDSILQLCESATVATSLQDAGIPWIGIEESHGGSGGDLGDAVTATLALARAAQSTSVAETSLAAGWALSQAGIQVPQTLLAPAFILNAEVQLQRSTNHSTLSGFVHDVPGIQAAEYIVVSVDSYLCLVSKSQVTVTPTINVAHDDRGTVHFDFSPVQAIAELPTHVSHLDLLAHLAFARAVQLSGALIAVRDISIEFAKTREQFGKPIAELQVVAHYLAQLAELALVGEGAIASAVEQPTTLNFAIAKSVTGRAAREATRIAHQVHGAMGLSQEYALGWYTTHMWAWTEEAGRPEFWNTYIGEAFLEQSKRNLWVSITDGIEGEYR